MVNPQQQNNPADGSGTMTAVLVIGGPVLAIAGALWAGLRSVELVYPGVRPGFAGFLATLYNWGSATVWRTGQPLPSPAAWHWIAVIVSALVFVIVVVVFEVLWRALHRRGEGKDPQDMGTPPPRPRGW
jgi:hypothetical protein